MSEDSVEERVTTVESQNPNKGGIMFGEVSMNGIAAWVAVIGWIGTAFYYGILYNPATESLLLTDAQTDVFMLGLCVGAAVVSTLPALGVPFKPEENNE